MRIIVCGGRDYADVDTVHTVVSALDADTVTILQGGAPGADQAANNYARALGFEVHTYEADWYGHDQNCYHRPRLDNTCPAAGPRRNQQMLDAGADLVIAFPGGRGTEDMVSRAKNDGVKVLRVEG